MPTVLTISRSNAAPIPLSAEDEQSSSYKEIIKQLAAQAPKPYGAIPPLLKKRRKKQRQRDLTQSKQPEPEQRKPMRRMSHVEDWIVVDSKESLPDEEELVLPLHMPPPSLSDPAALAQQSDIAGLAKRLSATGMSSPLPTDAISAPASIRHLDVQSLDEDDEDEDDEDVYNNTRSVRRGRRMHPNWKSDGEEEDEEDEEDEEEEVDYAKNVRHSCSHKDLVRRHSISSFSKSQTPSTSTTASSVMSSSPPLKSDHHQVRWLKTIAQLRRSLVKSAPLPTPKSSHPKKTGRIANKKGFIPMPLPPRRPSSQRRRSEATTQPRFNPETNTYTRDTRSNPDHLRMISAELNMMRARKLLSPLKPRGFLPRRKDSFIRGEGRRRSHLQCEL
ncbi:hypothetical protein EC973_002585 [Apophysomyces ossiformis]|uniref:Uncharacterized protein n=1 Tax=Apophysomyces ossiformis TaxID=679940 RepID=A0A8H7EMT6_9FUNG|nr:hypothetical protein EC973_002585 [Apophysomyces ossiformis]